MTPTQIKILKAGVRNLKEFGYTDVDEKNILTDIVYSDFFRSMIRENKGMGFDSDLEALEDMISAS